MSFILRLNFLKRNKSDITDIEVKASVSVFLFVGMRGFFGMPFEQMCVIAAFMFIGSILLILLVSGFIYRRQERLKKIEVKMEYERIVDLVGVYLAILYAMVPTVIGIVRGDFLQSMMWDLACYLFLQGIVAWLVVRKILVYGP